MTNQGTSTPLPFYALSLSTYLTRQDRQRQADPFPFRECLFKSTPPPLWTQSASVMRQPPQEKDPCHPTTMHPTIFISTLLLAH